MIPEITDKNLYLLLPGKVAAVVEQYVEDNGVSILDGLRKFYNSSTYRKLEKEQTKLWHLGPVALYQERTFDYITIIIIIVIIKIFCSSQTIMR